MTRDFILSVLEDLALWHWPVFFWDLVWFQRYHATLTSTGSGLISYGVTPKGRIVITMLVRGDKPDPMDWTNHATREPWAKLDLDFLAQATSHFEMGAHPLEVGAQMGTGDSDLTQIPPILKPLTPPSRT